MEFQILLQTEMETQLAVAQARSIVPSPRPEMTVCHLEGRLGLNLNPHS